MPFSLLQNLRKCVIGSAFLLGCVSAHAEVIAVGATPTAVPFHFLDVKTNTLQGVLIDVIHAVGKDAGFEPQVQAIPFTSLIPSLQTDRIEIVASLLAMTPQRREVVDFSDPILTFGETLAIPAGDNKDYKTPADLNGMTVGTMAGTTFVEMLQKTPGIKEVRIFDSMPEMLRDLTVGRIDAAMGDRPVMQYLITSSGNKKVKIAPNFVEATKQPNGLTVKKGDKELLDRLNASLARLKANGTLDEIYRK